MADTPRLEAYRAVIERLVDERTVVVEIGTGAGIQALLAARAGAKHVYAIEPENSIKVAEHVAKENGYSDRISFFHGLSTKIDLPERADLILSDLHGILPYFYHHIPTIVDARTRLLKSEGRLVPQKDILWAAPVQDADLYEKQVGPWKNNTFGFDYSRALNLAVNSWGQGRPDRSGFLTSPQKLAELDYRSVESPDLASEGAFTVVQDGTLHGFSVWFDVTLFEDITLSNAPNKEELAYGTAFYPVEKPVEVVSGDQVVLGLRAVYNRGDYIWSWNTRVTTDSGDDKAAFDQSTFKGKIFVVDDLKKRMATYQPTLSSDGLMQRDALNLLAEGLPLLEVAKQLFESHPDVFKEANDALEHVRDLSQKFG